MSEELSEVTEICEGEFKNWNLETIYDPVEREEFQKTCENIRALWKEHSESISKSIRAVVEFVSKCPHGGHPVKGSTKPTFLNKPHHRKRRR